MVGEGVLVGWARRDGAFAPVNSKWVIRTDGDCEMAAAIHLQNAIRHAANAFRFILLLSKSLSKIGASVLELALMRSQETKPKKCRIYVLLYFMINQVSSRDRCFRRRHILLSISIQVAMPQNRSS